MEQQVRWQMTVTVTGMKYQTGNPKPKAHQSQTHHHKRTITNTLPLLVAVIVINKPKPQQSRNSPSPMKRSLVEFDSCRKLQTHHRPTFLGHDNSNNQTVQSKRLCKNKNENHDHEQLLLLADRPHPCITDDPNCQPCRYSREAAAYSSRQVCVPRIAGVLRA